jgi:hypothetical protein
MDVRTGEPKPNLAIVQTEPWRSNQLMENGNSPTGGKGVRVSHTTLLSRAIFNGSVWSLSGLPAAQP